METHNHYKINFLDRTDFDFRGIGLTSCLIIDEALKRNIKAEAILNKYVLLERNGKEQLFYGSDNPCLSGVTKQILCSKIETKEFLTRGNLSVPEGRSFNVNEIDKIITFAKKIDGKIVIKPDNTDFGYDVYCKLEKEEIEETVTKLSKKYKRIVVEEFVEGNEYRILVIGRNFFAVCMRRPASVFGDGESTIKKLIDKKNVNRQSAKDKIKTLPWIKIEIDDITLNNLKKQNLDLNSIPRKDERIYLRHNSNVSSGGDSIELTDKAHESVKKIAKKVLETIPGLTYAGIDLITEDITKDITNNYHIIEVNNMPGIKLHHYPYIGKPRNVASALIDLVFPET